VQVVSDPEGFREMALRLRVDLAASREAGEAVLVLEGWAD
jgi:hypothetical protein